MLRFRHATRLCSYAALPDVEITIYAAMRGAARERARLRYDAAARYRARYAIATMRPGAARC